MSSQPPLSAHDLAPAQPHPHDDACGHEGDPLVIPADDDVGRVQGESRGIIAVDMDDVLCNTNGTIVDMHPTLFPGRADPPLTLDEFHHYLYWHNRGWGGKEETVDMVGQLYRAGLMERPTPIPGAKEGLQRLKDLGYTLIIITARSEVQREGTEQWIADHLPDLFDEIHFTGAFNHLIPATRAEHEGHAAHRTVVSHKKRTKHEVMRQTGATLLIDDSSENALAAAAADPPERVLLFGGWPWNVSIVPPDGEGAAHPDDKKLYVELAKEDGGLAAAAERRAVRIKRGWLPKGVERVADWNAVVDWVDKYY
ncbi:hypothetical protein Q8F55_001372 [Vanrija albida]|uniref:FCP1 homology domain-containing protein n=1 Tax=Vanrija albida TaxID=181172 RepID=A0ABR3QGB9_9TREE